MIYIEKAQVMGLEPAVRSMRNQMNSWEKSDSRTCVPNPECPNCEDNRTDRCYNGFILGSDDRDLMPRPGR